MPRIREYEQQYAAQGGMQEGLDPSVTAPVFRAVERIGQSVAGAGEMLEKAYSISQTSKASNELTDLKLKYISRIKDDSLAGSIDIDKVNEQFNEDITSLSNNYMDSNTRNYIQRSAGDLRESLSISMINTKAELTRVQILEDNQSWMDKQSALLIEDPTQYSYAISDFENKAATWGLSPKELEKMRTENFRRLGMAQAQGIVRNTPEGSLSSLRDSVMKKGSLFDNKGFSGEDKLKIEQLIKSEMYARESERARQKRLLEERDQSIQDAAMNEYLIDSGSGENKRSREELMRDPRLSPEKKMSLSNFLDSFGKRVDKRNSNALINEAYKKMLLPDGDPSKIVSEAMLKPYVESLDHKDAQYLLNIFMKAKTPEEKANQKLKSVYFESARKQLGIDPLSKIVDVKAEEQLASLQLAFESEYAKKVSEGISPRELLNPQSKHSLYPLIQDYRRGLNERMKDLSSGLKTNIKKPSKKDGTEYSHQEWMALSPEERKKIREGN